MIVKFNVPAGSGLSVTGYQDGSVDLYIKASFLEELSLEMDEETAVKVGYSLLKMTGSLESSDNLKNERPQGEWGKHGECPFCSYIKQWENDKFCGNCGAKLGKGGAENE